jgi:hypothetical protein
MNIDRQGQPRPLHGKASNRVDDDNVDQSVVDLHERQRPWCLDRTCRWHETIASGLATLPPRQHLGRRALSNASLDRAPARRFQPGLSAPPTHLANEMRYGWLLAGQIDFVDDDADEFVDLRRLP